MNNHPEDFVLQFVGTEDHEKALKAFNEVRMKVCEELLETGIAAVRSIVSLPAVNYEGEAVQHGANMQARQVASRCFHSVQALGGGLWYHPFADDPRFKELTKYAY